MKKIYLLFIIASAPSVLLGAPTLNDLNRDLILSYNTIFGAEDLFAQKITPEKINQWQALTDRITQYVTSHDKDIFGTQDPTLATGLESIQKGNQALLSTINATYLDKDNTSHLIKIAATFKSIEKQMNDTMKNLKDSSFILKRKKNARSLLATFALFIAIIAKNAAENTRIVRVSPETVQKFFTNTTTPTTPSDNSPNT